MANPSDVLMQLQAKLDTKYMVKNTMVKSSDDLEEDIGSNPSAATGAGFGSSLSNKRYSGDTQDVDVDDAQAVDEPYVTHRSVALADPDADKRRPSKTRMEKILARLEQAVEVEEPETEEEPAPVDEPEGPPEGGPEMPPPDGSDEVDPEDGDEMPAEGGEMKMGGEQEDEEKQTPSELGRIYELKKIYARLTTIESYLSESSDPPLLRMRLLVSKSIELFEILSSNIPSYRPPKAPPERIDEIIIMYYKFLDKVYESVANYFKEKQKSLSKDGLANTVIKLSDKELI